jgi:hypothetical protein
MKIRSDGLYRQINFLEYFLAIMSHLSFTALRLPIGLLLLAGGPVHHAGAAMIAEFEYGQSPVSVQLISSTIGPYNALLTTANTVMGFGDSLKESTVIEAGWANLANGTIVEFTFGSLVINRPGVDLWLFEARYDAGTFNFSTDYNGFATQTSVGSFFDTGLRRDYYVIDSVGTAGPYTASVFVAGIDLANLGIPDGAGVTKIRTITTNTGGDPLGLVEAVPEPSSAVILAVGLLCATMIRRRREGRYPLRAVLPEFN